MKIISLNDNSFMGTKTSIDGKGVDEIINCSTEYEELGFDERIADFDKKHCSRSSIEEIIKIIEEEGPDVFIANEYRRNFPSAIEFEKKMKENGYSGPLTHQRKSRYKYGFSTAFFVKNTLGYSDEENIVDPLTLSDLSLDDRVYSIEVRDFIIIGIHIPYEDSKRILTWDIILDYFNTTATQDKKILIIGDFNTYDRSGVNAGAYKKKEQLIQNGCVDIWLEMGGRNETPTQKPNLSRLDYAFRTKTISEKVIMKMIPEKNEAFDSDEWSLSDHRMLVVEIVEKPLADAFTKMFADRGETYTRDDVRRIFEEEGVDVSNFDNLLSRCIKNRWLIDCGDNNYTG